MSEELEQKKEEQKQTANQPLAKSALVDALRNDFATSVTKVYINSLKEEKSFREITVKEQKSLTRIMSANSKRKDIIYDAQCAMINTAALDKGFDVYQLSEYDRLKLMIALYQANMFQNEVKFVCEECGTENRYKLDFENVLHRLDSFELDSKTFEYENKNFKYEFVVQYPSVSTVSKFHAAYCRTHNKNVPKHEAETAESMENMEYINLFMKSVKFENKNTGKKTSVNFGDYKVSDLEEIISIFPQDVLYSEEGVLKCIVKEFIQPMNDAFDKHECWNCGTVHEKGNTNQVESFF